MGCFQSKQEKDASRTNEMIETKLKQDKIAMKNEVKLLLLGAGESGKSTIIKQMKLIHENGYSQQERTDYTDIVRSNLLVSIKVVLEAMQALNLQLSLEENQKYVDLMFNTDLSLSDCVEHDIRTALKKLWDDTGFKSCVRRASEYQLNDSAEYFFNSIERITQHDYLPSEEDILRSRVKSIGITETIFKVGNLNYKMVDVGGQRSERKKWIHCFENVTCIIYLAAVSEYDQQLFEDNKVKRFDEALSLFDSVCNSKWFVNTSVILFLNKIDILQTKLKNQNFKNYFPEYDNDNDFQSVCEFIKKKFVSINRTPTKQIYTHFTCATDTNQIKFVMSAVNDIVVQANLKDCGLL